MTCEEFRAMRGKYTLDRLPSMTECVAGLKHMLTCRACALWVEAISVVMDLLDPEAARACQRMAHDRFPELLARAKSDPELR